MNMMYMSHALRDDGTWTLATAFQCTMWFCVKSYSASMTGGVFKETLISSWPDLNEIVPGNSKIDIPSIAPSHPARYSHQNYTLKPPDQDTTYSVDTFTFATLKYWLSGVMNDLNLESSWASDIGQFFYESQRTNASDPSQRSGPSPLLERMADIMTSYMRSKGSPDLKVIGTTHEMLTYVHARWFWSILPVALVGMTFAFMALTIFLSVRNGIPIWKSSSLALMVHGLSDDISSRITAKNLDTMESNAEDYTMGIAVVRQRWRLKGALQ
jgi:hypothetical protein